MIPTGMFKREGGKYNDGALHAGRRSHLWITDPRDGSVIRFRGESLPKLLAITASDYEKNGKWSNTTFTFRLGTGVAAVYVASAMHAAPFDRYESWSAVVLDFNAVAGVEVDPASLEAVIRECYPKSASRLDEREAAAGDLL